MSGRGRSGSFRPRRGFIPRGRGNYSGRSSEFTSSSHFRSREFGSSFGHKPEIEMTKSLVMSVLEDDEPRAGRSRYKTHSKNFDSEDFGHDRKKYHFKDSERSMRDSRTHSESRRYSKDHNEEHYSRSSIGSKDSYKYVERKSSYNDYPGPAVKRQRVSSDGSFREPKFPIHREKFMPRESFGMHRESKFSFHRESRPNYTRFPRGRGGPKREYDRFPIKSSGRLNFNSERMLPFDHKRSHTRDDRMLVTMKPSGTRHIDGNTYHPHGGEHVELKCPHCPDYEAITFKDYRYHLTTTGHENNLNKLIRRHSAVLRKIRLNQRIDQRELEDSMNKEDPEKCRTAEKEFCGICKLVYKILSDDSRSDHSRSRFHKMQVQYLRPYCKTCKMSLISLLVYEHHTASIRHLRSISEKKMMEESLSEGEHDEKEDFDMENFVTMDAVGEDFDDSMSENEDVTGKMEDVEEAMKETEADYDDSRVVKLEPSPKQELEAKSPEGADSFNGDKLDDQLELLVEEYPSDDDSNLLEEPVGTEYLSEIDVMLCRLCGVAVRIDNHGSIALDKHCRSADHIDRYNELLERKNRDGRESRQSNDAAIEENSDVDDLAECSSPSIILRSPSQSGDDEEEEKKD